MVQLVFNAVVVVFCKTCKSDKSGLFSEEGLLKRQELINLFSARDSVARLHKGQFKLSFLYLFFLV